MADTPPKKSTPEKGDAPKDQRVFDVAHPSKRVASATSKPVIVGHTNTMKQDPMVAPKAPEPEKNVDPLIEDPGLSDTPNKASDVDPEVEITSETEPEVRESFDENELSGDNSVSTDEHVETDGESAVDQIVAGVNTKKDRLDQEEKEAKRTAEINGLIASKKYYVKTSLPPGKRNFRLVVVLLILVALGAVGWYFGVGPGKSYWSNEPTVPIVTSSQNDTTQEEATPSTNESTAKPAEMTTYTNAELGVSFMHPKDWQLSVAQDTEFPTRSIITLRSPNETIKTSTADGTTVDSDVYLRTRIIIENTTNPAEYASDLVNMTSCETEDITIASTPLKLVLLDMAQPSPSVSQASVATTNCTPTGASFSANDQVQLATKKNTYVMYTEYVLSDAQLIKNGTTSPESIALAQEAGVVTTKDVFVAGTGYKSFQEVVKSFKEL